MKTQGNLWAEENYLIQSSFYLWVFWGLFLLFSIIVKSMKLSYIAWIQSWLAHLLWDLEQIT